MSMQKYEPEEFARARYWQQQYLELERNFQKKLDEAEERQKKFYCEEVEKMEQSLKKDYDQQFFKLTGRLNEEADFLAQRLNDHRKEMEIFNLLPWYERLFHKFDLDNL